MTFERDDLEHVALLARLGLPEADVEPMRAHMERILDYVRKLDELSVEGIEPSAFAMDIANVLRDDREAPSLSREEALLNAPDRDEEGFRVPAILA